MECSAILAACTQHAHAKPAWRTGQAILKVGMLGRMLGPRQSLWSGSHPLLSPVPSVPNYHPTNSVGLPSAPTR